MGGHTMREGLTVGRSLSAATIVRLGGAGVNGFVAFSSTPSAQPQRLQSPLLSVRHHLAAFSQRPVAARTQRKDCSTP